MTARFDLKAATQGAHERVDAAYGGYNLCDAAGYGRFLAAQAAALIPLELALTDAGAARLVDRWGTSARSALLHADLAALGIAPLPPVEPPLIRNDAELAGALYVLEGSRLGAAILSKRVPPSFPARFLRAPPDPGRWTRFATSLDHLLDDPAKLDAAIATSLAVFSGFERAARGVQAAAAKAPPKAAVAA